MKINIHVEHLLTLSQAARSLPRLRGEKPVHVGTIARWIKRGLGGVRLEAVKIGRTLVTSREALQRFAERLADGDQGTPERDDRPDGGSGGHGGLRIDAKTGRIEDELDRHGL